MIFETERLLIRLLNLSDMEGYFELQSNPKVLKYAIGEVDSYDNIQKNLKEVIAKYKKIDNDFWIFAVENKVDNEFLGTVAYVKENTGDYELGYRFIEKFWNNGYGFEVTEGLIKYLKKIGLSKIVGYVVDKNIASSKILKKLNFKIVKKLICKDTGLPETKYQLFL